MVTSGVFSPTNIWFLILNFFPYRPYQKLLEKQTWLHHSANQSTFKLEDYIFLKFPGSFCGGHISEQEMLTAPRISRTEL